MSLQIGLGASQEDWDVQGEVDFDFFEENISSGVGETDSERFNHNAVTVSPTNAQKPIITISYGNENFDTANKTVIETVIPTPILSNEMFENHKNVERINFVLPPHCESPSKHSIVHKCNSKESSNNPISPSISEFDSDAATSSRIGDVMESSQSSTMSDESVLPSSASSGKNNRMVNISNHKIHHDCLHTISKNILSGRKINTSAALFNSFRCNCKYDKSSIDALLKAVKQLELVQNGSNTSSRRSTPVPLSNNSKDKKNMSFSNEEVRLIDQENQRLLKRILVQQKRSKPKLLQKSSNLPSSAVNRQRQQRQIELENMAFLKRLEAAKPSQGVCRSHLLRDYEKRQSRPSSSQVSRPSSAACSSLLSCSESSSQCAHKSNLKKARVGEKY